MAEGHEPKPLPNLKWYSALTGTTLTTTETVHNTFNGRKFSDYDVLIFLVGGSASDFRNSVIIPSALWATDKSILFTVLHGVNSENKTSVSISYNSDTSIKASVGISGAVNILQILGGKLE